MTDTNSGADSGLRSPREHAVTLPLTGQPDSELCDVIFLLAERCGCFPPPEQGLTPKCPPLDSPFLTSWALLASRAS
jgi:hypothetical protein